MIHTIRTSILPAVLGVALLLYGCSGGSVDSQTMGHIQGTVTKEGQSVGVPGLEMILVDGNYKVDTSVGADNSKGIIAKAVTDDNGHFTFGWLSAGKYGIAPATTEFLVTAKQAAYGDLFTLAPGELKQVDFSASISNAPFWQRLKFNFVMINAPPTSGMPTIPKLKVYRWYSAFYFPFNVLESELSPTSTTYTSATSVTITFDSHDTLLGINLGLYIIHNLFRFEYTDSYGTRAYSVKKDDYGEYNVNLSYDPVTIELVWVK